MSQFNAIEHTWLQLIIESKEEIATDIWHMRLRSMDYSLLPVYELGAHITVLTPSKSRRNYSLCSNPTDLTYYEIAIKLESHGRGGSQSIINETKITDLIAVSRPKNKFKFTTQSESSLFIAGGIGITPILPMVRHLAEHKSASFELIYCTRSRDHTPFKIEIENFKKIGQVSVHHTNGDSANRIDLWHWLEKPTAQHIYCCGPKSLMDEVENMTGHWNQSQIHMESFGVTTLDMENHSFIVNLSKTNTVLHVAKDETLLSALRSAGYLLPSSCESGTCGSCKLALLSGDADHRDWVLNDDEKKMFIMPCVSRANSRSLELDL